jgi:hypothetical protein
MKVNVRFFMEGITLEEGGKKSISTAQVAEVISIAFTHAQDLIDEDHLVDLLDAIQRTAKARRARLRRRGK